MDNFKEQVLDRSYEIPVLVDFWASWCGPCRVLTPVIEKIAEEQQGKWELVKINTEEYPDLAETYHIRSIPNVKLFYRGEVINEFLGALPRQAVLDWLRKSLPDEGLLALDHLLAETPDPAPHQLEVLANQYPHSEEIRLVYSQFIIWDQPARALKVLEPIKLGSPFHDKAGFLRDIISFLLYTSEEPEVTQIQTWLSASRIEEAMPHILDLLSKNIRIAEGKLAKATIGIFNFLGHQHPLTRQYRRQLDMYLWS